MSTKNYNPQDIQMLIDDSKDFQSTIESLTDIITKNCQAIDNRIKRKYDKIFNSVDVYNQALIDRSGDKSEIVEYCRWINQTRDEYEATEAKVNAIAENAGGQNIDGSLLNSATGIGGAGALVTKGIDDGLDKDNSGSGDADKTGVYKLNPNALENLSPKTKEVIKAKLKELGFTDKEIESILKGEMGVSNVKLKELSSKLEAALKSDPALRQKLIDLYGFDIFNEDGTVNKDRLALAMIMDAKNDKDKYDLNSLFTVTEKFENDPIGGEENFPTKDDSNKDSPIPDDIINGIANNVTGGTKPGPTNGAHAADDIKNLAETIEGPQDLISLGDDLTDMAGSVKIPKGILPTADTEVKKGSFGAVASVAGLGSAIAAAAGGFALTKKKKDGEEEGEEDVQFISEEDKYLNGEQKDDDTEDEDDKDWLYGLGIGLAGVGGLAGLADDDDEDYDDDDDSYYPMA